MANNSSYMKKIILFCVVFIKYMTIVNAVKGDKVLPMMKDITSLNQSVAIAVLNELMPKTFWLRPNEEQDLYAFGQQMTDFKRHPCRRVCQQGQSMTCYYRMVVHNYQRLGKECQRCLNDPTACASEYCIYGDGVPNGIIAINRMLPGPAIEVCENDFITVDVLNYLTDKLTVHWHGVHMSQTPEMDGAPFITQYPIQSSEIFRYSFHVDRSGTTWYHSHTAWQRGLGLAGALIIRQSKEVNRQAHLYNYDLIDHTLILQDAIYYYDFEQPYNILINGKGRNHLNSLPDNDASHRYERLMVTQGMRYRIRVISNGVFNCPLEFSIENHRMLVISTDGNDIEPVLVDKFFLTPAERFDFVLHANQYPGNYWIRVKGYTICETKNLYQGAVLNYRGISRTELPKTTINTSFKYKSSESFIVYNKPQELVQNYTTKHFKDAKATDVPIIGLRSLTPLKWPAYTKFITHYTSLSIRRNSNNNEKLYQMNDISFMIPTVALLRARHLYNEDSFYCNRSAFEMAGYDCRTTLCECTQVLRVPFNKPIEIVVANFIENTHPFHIHGHTFRLIGQDVLGNVQDLRKIKQLDRAGRLQRLPDDYPAVEKDTVQIPGLGYIIIRFFSNNPGFWLYHCHILPHNSGGMAAVLKVGENNEIKTLSPKLSC